MDLLHWESRERQFKNTQSYIVQGDLEASTIDGVDLLLAKQLQKKKEYLCCVIAVCVLSTAAHIDFWMRLNCSGLKAQAVLHRVFNSIRILFPANQIHVRVD
jgi:hypothetical protein